MNYVIERIYTRYEVWEGEADSLEEAVDKACWEHKWEIDGDIYVKGMYIVDDEEEFHDLPEELSKKLKSAF